MKSLTKPVNKPDKLKRLKPKQRQTLENWLIPTSETYGNLYASCIKAGFRPSYALNISHLRPSWLSETIEQIDFQPQHIKAGLQELAKSAPNSRSPDDTRLKSLEVLAKVMGMIDNKHQVTNITVQPILNGESIRPIKVKSEVVEHSTGNEVVA